MTDPNEQGYSIPHHFSPQEMKDFFARNRTNPTVSYYLATQEPVYGIVVDEPYGEILVWFDAQGELHVIDITNMAVANAIKQAPYESPDASAVQSIIDQLEALFTTSIKTIAALGALYLVLQIWMTYKASVRS